MYPVSTDSVHARGFNERLTPVVKPAESYHQHLDDFRSSRNQGVRGNGFRLGDTKCVLQVRFSGSTRNFKRYTVYPPASHCLTLSPPKDSRKKENSKDAGQALPDHRRYRPPLWGAPGRLQPHPHLQPALAATRKIPRGADHLAIGPARPGDAVLHVAPVALNAAVDAARSRDTTQAGLGADGSLHRHHLLACGACLHPVSRHGRHRSGVWAVRVPAGADLYRVCVGGCFGVVA